LASIKSKKEQIITKMSMNEIIRYKEKNGIHDYVEFVNKMENIDKRREFNLATRTSMKSQNLL
jgi:Mg/Co/Ni transporter MgtE